MLTPTNTNNRSALFNYPLKTTVEEINRFQIHILRRKKIVAKLQHAHFQYERYGGVHEDKT
jgi:hypothetical protein